MYEHVSMEIFMLHTNTNETIHYLNTFVTQILLRLMILILVLLDLALKVLSKSLETCVYK